MSGIWFQQNILASNVVPDNGWSIKWKRGGDEGLFTFVVFLSHRSFVILVAQDLVLASRPPNSVSLRISRWGLTNTYLDNDI